MRALGVSCTLLSDLKQQQQQQTASVHSEILKYVQRLFFIFFVGPSLDSGLTIMVHLQVIQSN